MMTLISAHRSTQQMSRSCAVRSIVAIGPVIKLNLDIKDLNNGVSPVVPKMVINEAEVVPIGRPVSSSSFNDFMSL